MWNFGIADLSRCTFIDNAAIGATGAVCLDLIECVLFFLVECCCCPRSMGGGDAVCSVPISRRLSEELAVLTSTHRMVVVILSRFCAVGDPRCAIIGLSPPWHLHRLCAVLFVGAGSIWCCDCAARAAVAVVHLPLFLCADQRAARCTMAEHSTPRVAPSSTTTPDNWYVWT